MPGVRASSSICQSVRFILMKFAGNAFIHSLISLVLFSTDVITFSAATVDVVVAIMVKVS